MSRARSAARWSATEYRGYRLRERHLGEAAPLAAAQPARAFLAQKFDRAHADAQPLLDALAVELLGHSRQLELAVQRLSDMHSSVP
jgi:hypothetical protein